MRRKKSQAAMEFLMTYGWAILVVIIVIGAFAYFGVLQPRNLVPRRCQLQGFHCSDHKLTGGGLNLVLTNAQGYDIKIDSVAFESETPGAVTCTATGSSNNVQIAVGDSETVSSGACGTFTARIGSRVKGFVNITFTEPVQNTQHKIVGMLITDVEG